MINKIINRLLYYDTNDTRSGEGFYPRVSPHFTNSITKTHVIFYVTEFNGRTVWCQKNGPVIMGLEGNIGIQLLVALNMEARTNATQIINSGGRLVFPKTYNSTFRILKENYK